MTEAMEFSISWGYLWWGSLPEAWAYKAEKLKNLVLPVDDAGQVSSRRIALRVSFPDRTGILGLEFAKFKSKTLSIEIYENNSKDGNVAVHAGLPEEFAEPVLEEIAKAVGELPSFSGGIIRVNHAAWHEVDSSPYVFGLLSRSLIELLLCETISRDIADEAIQRARQKLKA